MLMKTNYEKAVDIYNRGGQYAVYDAVESGELKADSMRDCLPCEDRTPHEGDTCLVCGTENARQPDPQVSHSIQFDDVDAMVLWLLENDVDNTPVTLTIHLGE
jgi:hypothetical protein